MFKFEKQYRQGDVNIFQTESGLYVPEGAKVADRDKGGVVLAYGEVSGHAHALYEGNVKLHKYDDSLYEKAYEQLSEVKTADGQPVFREEALERDRLKMAFSGWLEVVGGGYLVHGNLGLANPGTTQDHNMMWVDEGIHLAWTQVEYKTDIRAMAD